MNLRILWYRLYHILFVASCYKLTKEGRNCSKLLQIQIMNKNEKTTSIRFSPDTDAKISWLLEKDGENAKRTGMKPSNRTQIIEEAISEYYYRKINKIQDADVVGRIAMTVDDKVNASVKILNDKIDDIRYLIHKLDLGTKVLYRSPSVLPPPKNSKQAINIIINEESGWYNAIEEYMMTQIPRKEDEQKEKEKDDAGSVL